MTAITVKCGVCGYVSVVDSQDGDLGPYLCDDACHDAWSRHYDWLRAWGGADDETDYVD